jgi:hypothetical protein
MKGSADGVSARQLGGGGRGRSGGRGENASGGGGRAGGGGGRSGRIGGRKDGGGDALCILLLLLKLLLLLLLKLLHQFPQLLPPLSPVPLEVQLQVLCRDAGAVIALAVFAAAHLRAPVVTPQAEALLVVNAADVNHHWRARRRA